MGTFGSSPAVRLEVAVQVVASFAALLDALEEPGAEDGRAFTAAPRAAGPAASGADPGTGTPAAAPMESVMESVGTAVAAAAAGRAEEEVWTPVVIAEDLAALRDSRLVAGVGAADPAMVVTPLATGRIVAQAGRLDAGPVVGGSIGISARPAGTLGGCVRSRGGELLGVTAGHVVSDGQGRHLVGQAVSHPAPADGGGDVIGVVLAATELRAKGNTADLGLIDLHGGGGAVHELGALGDEHIAGRPVTKTGRTTQRTRGWVSRVGARRVAVWVGGRRYRFDGLFAIESDDGAFSDFGDSGALVLDEEAGDVLGMVVAGSPAGGRGGGPLTWAVPSRHLAGSMAVLLDAGGG